MVFLNVDSSTLYALSWSRERKVKRIRGSSCIFEGQNVVVGLDSFEPHLSWEELGESSVF